MTDFCHMNPYKNCSRARISGGRFLQHSNTALSSNTIEQAPAPTMGQTFQLRPPPQVESAPRHLHQRIAQVLYRVETQSSFALADRAGELEELL